MPSISLDISEEKKEDFIKAFLKECPQPDPFIGTSLDWVKEWGRQQYLMAYSRGKIKLAQESVLIDGNVIK